MADMGDNAGTKMNGIVISNMCEPPSVVIELAADKPSRRQRSHSVRFSDEQPRRTPQPPQWSRRSLPPAKRDRRRDKGKGSNSDNSETNAAPETAAAEFRVPRSKSVDFKRARSSANSRQPRSLSFASGSSARRTRRAREDAEEYVGGLFDLQQFYRRASIRSVLPVVQNLKETKSRKWIVAVFSLVAATLASLRGFTLAFSSGATLDLRGAADELPTSYLFSTTLISIFAVS